MSRISELIQAEPEDVLVGLVMRLTGGSVSPEVVRAQIARSRSTSISPYIVNNSTARAAVVAFVAARCSVASQHNLPTEEDLMRSAATCVIGEGRMRIALGQLIRAGKIHQYGPYLSDREVAPCER